MVHWPPIGHGRKVELELALELRDVVGHNPIHCVSGQLGLKSDSEVSCWMIPPLLARLFLEFHWWLGFCSDSLA